MREAVHTNLETFLIGLIIAGVRGGAFAMMDLLGDKRADRLAAYWRTGAAICGWTVRQ